MSLPRSDLIRKVEYMTEAISGHKIKTSFLQTSRDDLDLIKVAEETEIIYVKGGDVSIVISSTKDNEVDMTILVHSTSTDHDQEEASTVLDTNIEVDLKNVSTFVNLTEVTEEMKGIGMKGMKRRYRRNQKVSLWWDRVCRLNSPRLWNKNWTLRYWWIQMQMQDTLIQKLQ